MSSDDIFTAAAALAQKLGLPYAGAMPPQDAQALHEQNAAVIVDVRTAAELIYVGRVPHALAVEWQTFPDMAINEQFLPQLQALLPPHKAPVLFLCRSGARSHNAAAAAAAAGYRAYNILEGFEGELDGSKHRSTINGWRARGLPWNQS